MEIGCPRIRMRELGVITDNRDYLVTHRFRYFTRSQLRDLFVLNDPLRSETQVQLEQMHTKQRSHYVATHVAFLLGTKLVFGVSHHDLMFSTEEEKEDVPQQQREFITHQVRF